MSLEIQKILGVPDHLDKKSANSLAEALGKSMPREYDYMKFKQSLYAMRDLNLDETIALRSAFAAAQTMGVTKSKLLDSAQQYLSVLMNEKTKFGTALNNQVKERVESKRLEVVKLQQRIEEIKQKILDFENKVREYQNKIKEHENTINTADDVVGAAKQKILDTKNRFESTLQSFVDTISKDVERINQFL